MSEQDREKWNRRYATGAAAQNRHPSELLQQAIAAFEPPCGRALDIACGAGRNALYLAGLGYQVDGVDISGEALSRGRQRAAELGLAINWIEHDLSEGLNISDRYQLIVMLRYVNLPLLAQLPKSLAPGGLLVVEQHLQTDAAVSGPRDPRFRVAPGALAEAVDGLQPLLLEEGFREDPDGRTVALARLITQQPGAD